MIFAVDMDDIGVDHYAILGLPSGEEGAKLSKHDINKAYRSKAKKVHPDKRPGDDPNIANSDFRQLHSSYEFLMDDKRRNLFDILHRKNRENHRPQEQQDRRRQRTWSDLLKREWSAPFVDLEVKAREDEERRKKKLDEEFARIMAMYDSKRKTRTAFQAR